MNTVFSVQAVMSLVDNITAPLRAVRGSMAGAEQQAASLAGQMGNLAKAMLPFAAAAGVFLTALAPCVSTAADFQAAISRVGAVSRAAPADLHLLTQAARDLGASTAWSASEVAEGEKYLAMAGFSVKANIAALPGVLNLASAAQEDLGNTANIASNILSAFKMKASETGKVADILTAAFTSSNTTLSGLASTMANAAPLAAAAGASLSDVAAMAGKLGDVGIDASMAGTGIKIMFQRLQGPTGAAALALKNLGIETKDAAGNMLPIFDILRNLQSATAAMGSSDKAQIMKKIFGEEAIGSVTALMNTGIDTVQKYAETLKGSAGIAAGVAAGQLNNLRGALTILSSAYEGLKISIGNIFLPVLTSLTQGISTVVGWLRIIADTGAGKVFIGMAAAVAVAVIAVTAFAGASALAAMTLPFIVGALTAAGAALAAISWPIWLIVAALGVLYLAWRKNLGGIADIMAGWWNKISLIFQGVHAVFASLSGTSGMIEGSLAKNIKAAGLTGLVTTVAKVVFRIREFFSGLWDSVSFGLSAMADIFKPVIYSLAYAFKPLFTIISYVAEALLGASASTDASGWRTLGEIVGTVVTSAFEILAWAVRGILTPVKWAADIIGFLLSCFIGLGRGIGWAAGWISVKLEALPVLVGRISGGVVKAFNWMLAGIKWAFMNLTPLGWVIQAFSGIKGFLNGIDLSECGAKLMKTFVTGIKSMLMAPVNLIKSGLHAIRNLLPFSDAKEGPLSTLTASGRAMMNTLGAGVRNAAPGLTKAVKGAMAIAGSTMVIATPAMATVAQPDIPGIAPLRVQSEVAQPDIPGIAPLRVQSEVAQPKIPGIAPLRVQSEVAQPDIPGIAPLRVQSEVAQPKIPGIAPLRVQSEVAQPDIPKLNFEPSEAFSGKEQTQPRIKNTNSTINRGHRVIIQNLTLTLPRVQNAETFVEQLQRLVDGYDG